MSDIQEKKVEAHVIFGKESQNYSVFSFNTESEKKAFIDGLKEADGWNASRLPHEMEEDNLMALKRNSEESYNALMKHIEQSGKEALPAETEPTKSTSIKEMSVEEIMNELSERAVKAGAINDKNQLALLMFKRMMPASRCALGGAVEGSSEIFIELSDLDIPSLDVGTSTAAQLQKAKEFGIECLNGY